MVTVTDDVPPPAGLVGFCTNVSSYLYYLFIYLFILHIKLTSLRLGDDKLVLVLILKADSSDLI